MRILLDIRTTLKIFGAYSIIAYMPYVNAQEAKPYCGLQPTPVAKKVRINDFPSFFFKVHPLGDYVAYIGHNGNQLLDLNTGKSYPIPGSIDPAFSPDGKHLLVPMNEHQFDGPLSYSERMELAAHYQNGGNETRDGMAFYDVSKFTSAMKKGDQSASKVKELHSSPLFWDEGSSGVYQSSSTSNGKLSVLTDENSASLSSYTIGTDSFAVDKKMNKICGNIENLWMDLPMLSKDGRFVSTLNSNTQTTQIYEISQNGDCSLATDLGIATGKVSFNKDSSQITFHVDHFSTGDESYFSGVSSDITKDVYVVNLEEPDGIPQLKPTTWARVTNNENSGDGSYYPDFSESGDIFFLNDVDNYFEFVKVEQKDLDFVPFLTIPSQPKQESQADANTTCVKLTGVSKLHFLLGQMWSHICKNYDKTSLADSILLSMALNSDNCHQLVQENWGDKVTAQIRKNYSSEVDLSFMNDVSIDDLVGACPSPRSTKVAPEVIGRWEKRNKANMQQIVRQKCMMCHSGPLTYNREFTIREYYDENGNKVRADKVTRKVTLPAFNPNEIDAKTSFMMMESIASGDPSKRMPKGGRLTDEEATTFYLFNQRKQLERPSADGSDFYSEMYGDSLYVQLYSPEGLQREMDRYLESNAVYLKDNPDRERIVAQQKQEIWCKMGQQGCKELVSKKLAEMKDMLKAQGIDIQSQDIKKKLADYNLVLRCSYKLEVTYEDCQSLPVVDFSTNSPQ